MTAKKIAILGSSGSIGTSTLTVARHLGPEKIKVVALAAQKNSQILEQQLHEFQVKLVALYCPKAAADLRQRCPDVTVLEGLEGLQAIAQCHEADLVVSAITGTMGLLPTVAAIQAGKTVALANKESLVSGGGWVMDLAKRHNSQLLPVDSEHSALFQCLAGNDPAHVSRLILTASGGPFRSYSNEQLQKVTVEEALNHPTWRMGPKVTVDSSTLMNKGLEVIEARWLFNIPPEKISVVIHPQSLIHSMVEYVDGSTLAQVSQTQMTLPIQYALTYPERMPSPLKPLSFAEPVTMEFYPPDFNRFRCLKLAFDCLKAGQSYPCYLNAANEILVERFLKGELPWCAIASTLETLLEEHPAIEIGDITDILAIDQQARQEAKKALPIEELFLA